MHLVYKIALREYIAVATRNTDDENLVDLLLVYTQVTLPIPKHEEEFSTCVVYFKLGLCSLEDETDSTVAQFREIL